MPSTVWKKEFTDSQKKTDNTANRPVVCGGRMSEATLNATQRQSSRYATIYYIHFLSLLHFSQYKWAPLGHSALEISPL